MADQGVQEQVEGVQHELVIFSDEAIKSATITLTSSVDKQVCTYHGTDSLLCTVFGTFVGWYHEDFHPFTGFLCNVPNTIIGGVLGFGVGLAVMYRCRYLGRMIITLTEEDQTTFNNCVRGYLRMMRITTQEELDAMLLAPESREHIFVQECIYKFFKNTEILKVHIQRDRVNQINVFKFLRQFFSPETEGD